jgi:hypothetical protein
VTPTPQATRMEPDANGATDVEAALARAVHHARNAAAESLEAIRALLDAVAILLGGASADSHAVLSKAAEWLDRVAGELASGPQDAALTRALSDALEAEIARWEERARNDPEARAVLRAFLGVRELLWELGVRPTPKTPESAHPAPEAKRARHRRVERVPIQG